MNHLDTEIQDYPDELVYETYPDDDDLVEPADQRWRPVAVIAAVVFVLAVIATVVILNGGDSTSTTATVAPPTRTVIATPRPTSPPSASLPPETVTTVTPPPREPSVTASPTEVPSAAPPAEAAPAPLPPPSPNTVVYRVTGTKGMLDLVNIVYTDEQGLPRTDLNVSLPWSKAVILNPGVQTKSVVATSLTGRLNCEIIDAQGQPVAVSASNTIIATCAR
ncbi:MmpS family transport accessory protein [Mycobacterium kyorinense]|uniref:MmpS3 protein n=1 Tax=Mycobacterium kyorinense TaxID=487514 RepID=A0A1X1Y8I9_9MYCO|nr:MmpS family transport accessory protein [Mycobacterium kyorinense]ORW07453.1 hypothetical protein AWC14_24720 [Mycobacterium kyorinense]